jgi:hypothetical protein
MGRKALPLLFAELEREPDHWFPALSAITGVDPVPEGASFKDAVGIWLAWAREKGYLKPQWSATETSRKIFPDCGAVIMQPPAQSILRIIA